MSEPYLAVKDYITGDTQFARILVGLVLANVTSGKITSLGTAKIDCIATIAPITPTYAAGASDAKYFDTKLSTGNILRRPDNSIAIDITSGYKTAVDTKTTEAFDGTIAVGITDYKTLLKIYRDGTPVVVIRGMGYKAEDESVVGYEHLICKITEFTPTNKEGVMEVKVKFTGGQGYTADTGVTFSAYNSLACGSSNTIEPAGEDVLTIKNLTADDFTSLLTGKILQTAAA